MDYVNQAQGAPADGGQARPDSGEQAGAHQTAQPQPGGYYQFQPGVGFVQVQGAPAGAAPDAGMNASAAGQQMGMGSTDAGAQAGMFGPGTPEGAEPKFDQQKLGKMYSTVNDVMNGDADPSSLVGLFAENSGEFWKGALVGAAAVVLLNNDAVKGALKGLAGSVGAMFGEADPEGEQVTVGGK